MLRLGRIRYLVRATPANLDTHAVSSCIRFSHTATNSAAALAPSQGKKGHSRLLSSVTHSDSKPQVGQLAQLGVAVAVPMMAFGFMDNFIMITAGDAIDSSIGATLGLSTLAAAGIGNLFSDVAGVWSGDAVENGAKKAGLVEPHLSDEQADHPTTKLVKSGCSALGIAIGCILGMVPLLWQKDNKPIHMSELELKLFETVFSPHGVDVKTFITLVNKGKWCSVKAGDVLFEGGKPLNEAFMIVSGRAQGFKPDGSVAHYYFAKGSSPQVEPGPGQEFALDTPRMRGNLIGAKRLLDHQSVTYEPRKPYKYTVRATEPMRYLRWTFQDLSELMEEDRSVERAVLAFAHKDLALQVKTMKQSLKLRDHNVNREKILHEYEVLLGAVTVDGVLSAAERRLCEGFARRNNINTQEHVKMLEACGWSESDWEKGFHSSITDSWKRFTNSS